MVATMAVGLHDPPAAIAVAEGEAVGAGEGVGWQDSGDDVAAAQGAVGANSLCFSG